MLRSIPFSLVMLLAATLTGCGETKTSSSEAVAVVNMETVAMMTGADLEMNKAIQDRNKQLGESLAQFQAQIDSDWKAKQEGVGENPTDEQKQKLDKIFQELNFKARQAQAQARQNITAFQQELANKFRELLSPISLEIAKEHGYSIVIVENPSILAFDTSINITDLVVERIKKMKDESPGGLPAADSSLGTPAVSETKLPGVTQPGIPLNPPRSTKLKLPDLDNETKTKETEKKETSKKVVPESEKGKEQTQPASKPAPKETPKSEPKPETSSKTETKPVTKKSLEKKPNTEKPVEATEKK